MDETDVLSETEAHFGHVTNSMGPAGIVASYFPNIASFPGQIFINPIDISPRRETELMQEHAVRAGRRVERMNEHIRSGLTKHADMVVGSALQVQPNPDWDILTGFTPKERTDFADAARAQFNNWAFDPLLTADAEGHYDFGSLMWLAYRNASGPEGETFGAILRDEDRAAKLGSSWATFINVISPDRVRTPTMYAMKEVELSVFRGKQLDEYGRWEGLYVLKYEPFDPVKPGDNPWDFTFLPRTDATGRPSAWHWFEKTRCGAQRGMTKLVTSIRHAEMLDKFDDAQLGTAIINALLAPHVKSNAEPTTVAERLAPARSGVSPFDIRMGFYDKTKLRIGGKRVVVLPDGDELVMEAVNRAAQDPTAFVNQFLRRLAAVTGTTFEQLANNWSDANYSATRAALLDLWRGILRIRRMFSNVASLIYMAVVEEAIDKGRITLPASAPPFRQNRYAYCRCTWMGPGMGQIDPFKEAQANDLNLRNKTTNRQIIWADSSLDYYDGFVQIAAEMQEAKELGFELDLPMPGQNPGAAPSGGDPAGAGDASGSASSGTGEDSSASAQRAAAGKETA